MQNIYPFDDPVKNAEYEKNYIEWQKKFVAGDQLTEPSPFDGKLTPVSKELYWQSDKVFNLIGERVKCWIADYDASYLWGKGKAVDQIIPYQQEYNLLMNKITDLSKRISSPMMNVEDGSVDVDELCEEGAAPGKIIVYRQGSKAPCLMNVDPQAISSLYVVAQGVKLELIQLMDDIESNLD